MIYEFFTEDGSFKIDYKDYMKDEDLKRKVSDKRRLFLNLGLKLLSFDRKWLSEHPSHNKFVERMRQEQEMNPLRFFLPHCANSETFDSESHLYINDVSHVYSAILASNRLGKSTATIIKALAAFNVIPCARNWEIFTDHGIKWREWTGPKEIAVVSYNWANIDDTMWPQVVRAWLPKHELGKYVDYSAPKDSAFTIELTCGSKIHFKALSQPQGAFESQALDGFIWDEQATEEKFDGANARLRTRRTYSVGDDGYEYLTAGWHICGATPHKVEGRPDTGSGTWFEGMYNGNITKGLTTKFYHANLITDVPDWCYSEREKAVALNELQEAERLNNKKQIRAIRSRLFGVFEATGGMVYDEFDEEVHVIEDIKIQPTWSGFRCIDHGRTNPTACIWCAITPDDDIIAFQEYEGIDRQISDNTERIIHLSGNKIERFGDCDGGFGISIPRFREVPIDENSMSFAFDVLDGRSFRKTDDGTVFTVGSLYQFAGLHRLQGAPLQGIDATIPIVKEALRIRGDRKHIITGKPGAPRLYIIGSRCPNLIKHIKGYKNVESKTRDGAVSEKAFSRDDHDLDALRYGMMMGPVWREWTPILPSQASEKNRRSYWVEGEEDEQQYRNIRWRRRDARTRHM